MDELVGKLILSASLPASVAEVEKPPGFLLPGDSIFPCQLTSPDSSVFEIILNDGQSAIKQIGNTTALIREYADLPFVRFCTNDRKEILTLFLHPGGGANEFAEAQVSQYAESDSAKAVSANAFITNSGIRLGLSKEKVISIVGSCFKTINLTPDKELIEYRIDDYKNSGFLQRFNYPSYYAKYEFQNDRLVRFRFGFEYP